MGLGELSAATEQTIEPTIDVIVLPLPPLLPLLQASSSRILRALLAPIT